MKAAKDKYFHGDELPGVAVRASVTPSNPRASSAETASH